MPGSLDRLDIRFCIEGEYLATMITLSERHLETAGDSGDLLLVGLVDLF